MKIFSTTLARTFCFRAKQPQRQKFTGSTMLENWSLVKNQGISKYISKYISIYFKMKTDYFVIDIQIQSSRNRRAFDHKPPIQRHGNLHLSRQELGVQRCREHFPLPTCQQEVNDRPNLSSTINHWRQKSIQNCAIISNHLFIFIESSKSYLIFLPFGLTVLPFALDLD